jgi:uncharacterized protein YaiI (UPF0178 family)
LQNSVYNQLYKAQIQFYNLPVKKCVLQAGLKKYTNRGQHYKQAYVRKTIIYTNHKKQTQYSTEHENKSIDSFWQYIFFTDKFYFDSSSVCQGYILQERGKQYNQENIQERREKTGVKLYTAV